MSDLVMIVLTFAVISLCSLYVRWCDRIATDELLTARERPHRDEQAAA